MNMRTRWVLLVCACVVRVGGGQTPVRNQDTPTQTKQQPADRKQNAPANGGDQVAPGGQNAPANGGGQAAPGGQNAPVNGGDQGAPPPNVTPQKVQPAGPNGNGTPSSTSAPPSTPSRFDEAIQVVTDPLKQGYPSVVPFQTVFCSNLPKVIKVTVHWGGGASQSHLRGSGNYCFTLDQVNRILYDYTFSGTVPAVQETPLDLLSDAISSITSFGSGGQTPTKSPTPTPACSVSLDASLSAVTSAAAQLNTAISGLDPGKDSSGKVNSGVRYETTKALLDKTVTPAFDTLQTAIGVLIQQMGTDPTVAAGCADTFGQAEAVIFSYVTVRSQYQTLIAREQAAQVAEYEQNLEEYSPFSLAVSETANGAQTNASSETYNFDPLYSLLTSSAGFMITSLPSRSYTTATAPDPSNPTTATQDVLVVNNLRGIRPTVDALINVNVPWTNWQSTGFGFSVGPVYDISNGKANTSNLGLFGGISWRLTDYFYLTPGFHVGQFADFPQGFTHSGQVIPPNTGTPTAVNRYTARFGVSLTFKLKDLYSPKTASSSATASSPAQPQSQTAKPSSTNQAKKSGKSAGTK